MKAADVIREKEKDTADVISEKPEKKSGKKKDVAMIAPP